MIEKSFLDLHSQKGWVLFSEILNRERRVLIYSGRYLCVLDTLLVTCAVKSILDWRCDHSRHFSDLRDERPPDGGISVGHDSVVWLLPSDANHQPATQRQDTFISATAEQQPQRFYQACPRQRSLRDPENPRESVDSDFPFCGRG
ncbi:hypothetical protein TNCT_517991 [Trichonephila clavata]|uniref:Uncharacterized protein n=1 Tax=Trichonephila clavata TaxID=2740835 RepID=A0A8X6LTD1_TRICU|nr:hypothetical protein TNCT_517991 [Trichonephila clavata]